MFNNLTILFYENFPEKKKQWIRHSTCDVLDLDKLSTTIYMFNNLIILFCENFPGKKNNNEQDTNENNVMFFSIT